MQKDMHDMLGFLIHLIYFCSKMMNFPAIHECQQVAPTLEAHLEAVHKLLHGVLEGAARVVACQGLVHGRYHTAH